MKKLNKFLGVISTIVLGSTCLGSFSVNAEEVTEEKLYTLEELFAMSEEEFLALDNTAINFYQEVRRDADYTSDIYGEDRIVYGGISGILDISAIDSNAVKKYVANETEMKISELLGNEIDYEIESPISLDEEYIEDNLLFYGDRFNVIFPTLEQQATSDGIPDDDVIEMAKCCYCVNQVLDIYYYGYLDDLSAVPGSEILTGDANLDHVVDLYDVVHIAEYVAMNFEFTAIQKVITDVNNDGVVNSVDAVSVGMQIIEV